MGSKARRAAMRSSPPAPPLLPIAMFWRGWTSPEPQPHLLMSHTQTLRAQNLPLPFHRKGMNFLFCPSLLSTALWVSSLGQSRPLTAGGGSPRILPSHNPAGPHAASQLPLLPQLPSCSLATLPPQDFVECSPELPHFLEPLPGWCYRAEGRSEDLQQKSPPQTPWEV